MIHQLKSVQEFQYLMSEVPYQLIVLDFTASWCGPCHRIAPYFEKLSHENPNVIFYRIDIDEYPVDFKSLNKKIRDRKLPLILCKSKRAGKYLSKVFSRGENYQQRHPNELMKAMAMYENGEIDITGVGMADLERVLDPSSDLNKDVVIAPLSFSQYYIGFNVQKPPFDDKYFRQALAHAINKELIATEVLSGMVKPAYGILPPGFPGHDKTIEGLKFNEQLAKDMLAKSKYSNINDLPRLILSIPGTGGSAGLDIEVIIEMWKQTLGIEVEIQQVEWATFLQMLNRQELQFFSGLGWIADYPDPENFLDINFHSTKSTNHNGYKNEEVDKLLESARIEQDLNNRMQMYNNAERIIVDEAPWIPLWFPGDRYVLINQRVKNYKLTPMSVPKYSLVEIVD